MHPSSIDRTKMETAKKKERRMISADKMNLNCRKIFSLKLSHPCSIYVLFRLVLKRTVLALIN